MSPKTFITWKSCSRGDSKEAHLRSATDNQVEQCSEEKVDRRRICSLEEVLPLEKVIAWCIDVSVTASQPPLLDVSCKENSFPVSPSLYRLTADQSALTPQNSDCIQAMPPFGLTCTSMRDPRAASPKSQPAHDWMSFRRRPWNCSIE